jgi:Tfp pilus assembly protein PilZ
MKKAKIKYLLFAGEKEGVEEFVREIEATGNATIERAKNLELAKAQISGNEFQCLILNLTSFALKEVKTIEMFCGLNKNISVMIIARHIDELAYDLIKDLKNVVIVQRPVKESKIIALLAQKISTSRETFRREHWRYPTHQEASMEVLANHDVHWGHLANISRGGALFEIDHNINIIERELVRLNILLDQIPRIHIINAEVAWTSPFEKETKKMSLGLKFIDSKEINDSFYTKLKSKS